MRISVSVEINLPPTVRSPEVVIAAASIVPVKVGLALKTLFPEPVEPVTPVPPLFTAKVPDVIVDAE